MFDKVVSAAASNVFSTPARTVSAAAPAEGQWNARYAGAVPHTTDYYVKCMFGGVLSCGLTHAAIVPLDVVKCNMQVAKLSKLSSQAQHSLHLCFRACVTLSCLE
jgi:hypothetical protein